MPWPKGKTHSTETKRKMREAHQLRLQDPQAKATMVSNLDKGREIANSPEARRRTAERMRVQMTGRDVANSTKEKIRQANIGKKQSDETRAKRSAALKIAHAEGRHPGFPDDMLTRGSKIEDIVAELLEQLGVDFERQYFAHIPGCGRHPWDFGIPSNKILIEVDGCYWHGCKECGFEGAPGRPELDSEQTHLAETAGWKVIRFKEHDIKLGKIDLRLVA